MIIVLTGEDAVSSRTYLSQLIKNETNITHIDGKKQIIEDVKNAVSSNSLFSTKQIFVIEQFSKLAKQNELFEAIFPHSDDSDITIILWDNVVRKNKYLDDKRVEHKNFSFPKTYFNFLDNFKPDSDESLVQFHELLKTTTAEQIFFGLSKRIRHLMIVKNLNTQDIPEFQKMAPWQISKLKKQAGNWEEDDLKKLYLKFAETDEAVKTSSLPLPLSKHLDILLISTIN